MHSYLWLRIIFPFIFNLLAQDVYNAAVSTGAASEAPDHVLKL